MNDGPMHACIDLFPNVARSARFIYSARCGHIKPRQHRAENTIPKRCRHTVISIRKPVMVAVMLQQGSRENCGILMGAIMDE
jgi:hypothetical protein